MSPYSAGWRGGSRQSALRAGRRASQCLCGRSAGFEVQFKGLAPGLAAFYQLNIQIPVNVGPGPQSLAVQTNDAFTDMVNLWIGSPL